MSPDQGPTKSSGADGALQKQEIKDDKFDRKKEEFDPGASMLGTDDEAGSSPDVDEMAQARKAPPAPSQG